MLHANNISAGGTEYAWYQVLMTAGWLQNHFNTI